MLGDPVLSVGSPNDIRPEWRTFECEECGDVEDIDIVGMTAVTIYPCQHCGAPLTMIDDE